MAHRILIVEDHSYVREMLTRLINLQPGLEVCGAVESIEEALTVLTAGVDLVLLDLSLRSDSGLDLLATIDERWPGLPCIVLSGQPAVEYEASARAAGAVGYVEKGDAISLLNAIRDVFDPS